MGDDAKKPNLSDVRSEVRSPAANMPPAAKADFSKVQSQVSSAVDGATSYA